MKSPETTLGEIEKTQAQLRESIATARQLADKSDMLIKKHKRELRDIKADA